MRVADWIVHLVESRVPVPSSVELKLLEMSLDLLLLCLPEELELLHDLPSVADQFISHAPVRFHVHVLLDHALARLRLFWVEVSVLHRVVFLVPAMDFLLQLLGLGRGSSLRLD